MLRHGQFMHACADAGTKIDSAAVRSTAAKNDRTRRIWLTPFERREYRGAHPASSSAAGRQVAEGFFLGVRLAAPARRTLERVDVERDAAHLDANARAIRHDDRVLGDRIEV